MIGNFIKRLKMRRYGALWVPDVGHGGDVDDYRGFAIQLQDFYTDTIRGVLKARCPGVEVDLVYYDDDEVNAFAAPLSSSSHFVIGINKGLIKDIFNKIYDPRLESAVSQELRVLSRFESPTIPRYLMMFLASWVIFHEFSHITRGHIGYLSKLGLGEALVEVSGGMRKKTKMMSTGFVRTMPIPMQEGLWGQLY